MAKGTTLTVGELEAALKDARTHAEDLLALVNTALPERTFVCRWAAALVRALATGRFHAARWKVILLRRALALRPDLAEIHGLLDAVASFLGPAPVAPLVRRGAR